MGDKDKPLGHSHRVKIGSKRYKAAEWEEAWSLSTWALEIPRCHSDTE
jgi:hypothetical protein